MEAVLKKYLCTECEKVLIERRSLALKKTKKNFTNLCCVSSVVL